MSEQVKTELSMRDRLIEVLEGKSDRLDRTDWASKVISNLMEWVSSSDGRSLDAIKFIFDIVDGQPTACAEFRSSTPVAVSGFRHWFPGMTRSGHCFASQGTVE